MLSKPQTSVNPPASMTFTRCAVLIAAVTLAAAAVAASHGIHRAHQARAALAAAEDRLAMLRTVEQSAGDVKAQWAFLDEIARQGAAVDEARIVEWNAQVAGRLARAAKALPETEAARAAPLLESHRDFAAFAADLLIAHAAGDRETVQVLLPEFEESFAAIQARAEALRREAAADMAAAAEAAAKGAVWQWALGAGLLGFAAAVSLGLVFFASRTVRRGVDALLAGVKRIAGGDFATPIGGAGPGELGRLAKALDTAAGQLRVRSGVRETFGPHIDPGAVAGVIEIPRMEKTGGERRPMTVLAAALADSAGLAEHLAPADAVRAFNAWFDHVTSLLARHGGVVERRIDGGVMAYWGPPFTNAEGAPAKACAAALELVSGLDRLRGEIAAEAGGVPAETVLDVRAGIACGDAVAGMFGSKAARGFTVLGGPVELARRLEMLNESYETRLIIDDAARLNAGGGFITRELDQFDVSDARASVRVHELTGSGGGES